jgi:hypothetical protein
LLGRMGGSSFGLEALRTSLWRTKGKRIGKK